MRYTFGIYFVSIDAGAQVAVILLRLDLVWSLCMVGTGYVLWVELPVQGRLCSIFVSSVGLPDIHEYFRGLTGCQRTPGFYGVTAWYQSLDL